MNQLRMKLVVLELPLVSGFSYAFLRLIVDKLNEYVQNDVLFADTYDEAGEDDLRTPGGDVWALLQHVKDQMKLGSNDSNHASRREIRQLIADAENFLAVFELTDAEKRQHLGLKGQ